MTTGRRSPTDAELDEMFERSKNDYHIWVGSDIRILVGEIRALKDQLNETARRVLDTVKERNAARDNHLKVMKERDTAFSLLDSFRNAHVQEHRWGSGVCHLCLAAEKMTKP